MDVSSVDASSVDVSSMDVDVEGGWVSAHKITLLTLLTPAEPCCVGCCTGGECGQAGRLVYIWLGALLHIQFLFLEAQTGENV